MKKRNPIGSLSGKTIACMLVLACIALGVIGLVLPIIPGLVFLAIAALIAARHFPSVDARLRRHRALGRHLNTADGFFELNLSEKMQIAGWYCVKMFLETVAFIRSLVAKLRSASR
jgi:uncharacterized membrane protein YbaN (DUF454 family)